MPSDFSNYYTEKEKSLLKEICSKNGIQFSSIEKLIHEEASFHRMGKRKVLSSSISRIIVEATEDRLEKE